MPIKRQISISIVQIFLFAVCFSQTNKIDSLKKVLVSLADTARVDCLNQLSYEYTITNKKETTEHYIETAYQEAQRLKYIHGIAVSLCRKSHFVRHFYNDFAHSEALRKESLDWYERTGNKEGISYLYHLLSSDAFAQSKFEEAIAYSKKRLSFAEQCRDETETMNALVYIGGIYTHTGDYENSFLIMQQAYDYALKTKNKTSISGCLWVLGGLYTLIEDYHSAMIYFRRMWEMDDDEIAQWRVTNDCDIWVKM
jgi:tetratricopeptide (TPR) repeat protein